MSMVLVDTSVWVDYLRSGNPTLTMLLQQNRVGMHPHVLGELSLGCVLPGTPTYVGLSKLPAMAVATDNEVLQLIATQALTGKGIGYVDTHLLTSVLLSPGSLLFTLDKRLQQITAKFERALIPSLH